MERRVATASAIFMRAFFLKDQPLSNMRSNLANGFAKISGISGTARTRVAY
jgi:ABC-type sugar transport system ATPase subunit